MALNQRDAELAKKNRKAAKAPTRLSLAVMWMLLLMAQVRLQARKDFLWQKQSELQGLQRQWLEEEIEAAMTSKVDFRRLVVMATVTVKVSIRIIQSSTNENK